MGLAQRARDLPSHRAAARRPRHDDEGGVGTLPARHAGDRGPGREGGRAAPPPAAAREAHARHRGAHGYYAVALCRRHPRLRATVLDRPAAIEHAAPLLAREGVGERVVHRAGDARVDDLGQAAYDMVLMAQLVHHLDDTTNRDLVRRAARALRPGGLVAILEPIRNPTRSAREQLVGLLDLYFAFTSRAGTRSLNELVGWQREAGMVPQRPLYLRTLPGFAVQAATKT